MKCRELLVVHYDIIQAQVESSGKIRMKTERSKNMWDGEFLSLPFEPLKKTKKC